MTFSFDSRLILLGEIRGQTPLTAERVKSRNPQFHLLCQTKYMRKDNDRAMLFTPSWYFRPVYYFFLIISRNNVHEKLRAFDWLKTSAFLYNTSAKL